MFIIIFMMSFLCCLSLIVWQGAKKYEKSNTALMNVSVDFSAEDDQSDIDKGYIIKHKDGTYELVLGKKRFEISNPNDEYFKDVPIIKE